MSDTTPASPFAAPPAGEMIVVELDPRRQLAHRAIAGYLAGYSGATLDAYRLDLRQWVTWLDSNGVDILDVRLTSSCMPAGPKNMAWPARRSVGDCRRSAGSTGIAPKKL